MSNVLEVQSEEFILPFDSEEIQNLIDNIIIVARLSGLKVRFKDSLIRNVKSIIIGPIELTSRYSIIDLYYRIESSYNEVYKIIVDPSINILLHAIIVKNRVEHPNIDESVVKSEIRKVLDILSSL